MMDVKISMYNSVRRLHILNFICNQVTKNSLSFQNNDEKDKNE